MSDAKEQESVDLFDAYFDWDPSVDDSVFELYRYYGENTVNRVLQKDFICFRLSAAENFEDKMEGKAIEVYYDLALDRLKRAGKITQEEYDEYYPLDGLEDSYYSVFVNVDLNKASTTSGRTLGSEEEISQYIADMLLLESDSVFNIRYTGTTKTSGETFYEFRCYR